MRQEGILTIFFNVNNIFRKIIISVLICFFAVSSTAKISMADNEGKSTLTPLYEYWNPQIKDHHYTTKNKGRVNPGYKFKGIVCMVETTESEDNIPLLEYWNQSIGDHYYTTTWSGLSFGDCHYKNIICYTQVKKSTSNKPLHEYWNQTIGDHFYTTKYRGEIFEGYEYAGITCYVR